MKTRVVTLAVCVMVTTGVSASVKAQAPLSPGQEKLMAKRAAQVDAYRKLMEEIEEGQVRKGIVKGFHRGERPD